MEKNQYDLCIEVLRRLDQSGVLREVILIGSWCLPFYWEYFQAVRYFPEIRTRDIDLLIPRPKEVRHSADIPDLLKDLGFITGFKGAEKYMRLEHPDLVVEFLAPERGRGRRRPVKIPKWSVNAAAEKFVDLLAEHVIQVKVADMIVRLPHPSDFAFHKLIVFQRRHKKEKAEKDRNSAVGILKAMVQKGEAAFIRSRYKALESGWQKKILRVLKEAKEPDILAILE